MKCVVRCLVLIFSNLSQEDFKLRWRYLDKDAQIFTLV